MNGPGSIPGPTIPGTRHRVPGSQLDGVQLYGVDTAVGHTVHSNVDSTICVVVSQLLLLL